MSLKKFLKKTFLSSITLLSTSPYPIKIYYPLYFRINIRLSLLEYLSFFYYLLQRFFFLVSRLKDFVVTSPTRMYSRPVDKVILSLFPSHTSKSIFLLGRIFYSSKKGLIKRPLIERYKSRLSLSPSFQPVVFFHHVSSYPFTQRISSHYPNIP